MSLSIDIRSAAASAAGSVILVSGEVDVSNADELRSALDSCLGSDVTDVTVDLAGVPYIDSTGIGVLVGAVHHAEEHGKRFSVVNAQPGVMRVMQLLGVDSEIDVTAL